jgi:hypothetical protein
VNLAHKPILKVRFESGREACRFVLRNARTPQGHFLPMTPAELAPRLQAEGFFVTALDAEALLRDLASDGEAMEIDSLAGYRWSGHAA